MRKYILMVVAAFLLVVSAAQTQTTAATAAKMRAIPTLYLHGHHGGPRSMDALMVSAESSDRAHAVITAVVSRRGKVHLRGKWPRGTRRPLVKIVFKNNRTLRYHRISTWLHSVLVALQRRYGVTHFNVVAHSLGNAAVLFYELRYGRDHRLPQLNKYAAIAGNFDGIPGRHRGQHRNHIMPGGRPAWIAPQFRHALRRQDNLDLHNAEVLNIYGNIEDGSHSDGKVLNASSRALKYLLKGHVRTYHSHEFLGWRAQHSMLRLNPEVATAVDDFIWQEK